MTGRILRCAIYTRVSSDQGLEQDFNSLQAQREAAEAYIKSQAHEGWRLRREAYDDGGFSGGSMERPALQRLLAEVKEKHIDIIVVYKVDRLTRSLADFAKLVELFDAHGVSFVSVTQSFNTTSSMGRLTLNVLLSFAQFEREVTGERIRDKIAASKKKGIWMGGPVPLGYRVQDRKLVVDEDEAATVRLIFARYVALGSIVALQRELQDRGIKTRPRTLSSGAVQGGAPPTTGPLAYLLKNRMYLGELNHKGVSYPAEHAAILDAALFDAVQRQLASRRRKGAGPTGRTDALLSGRLFDDRGNKMSPSHALKQGIRYRYYVSAATVQGRSEDAGTIARIKAEDIETPIQGAIREAIRSPIHAEADLAGLETAELIARLDLKATLRPTAIDITWTPPSSPDADPSLSDQLHLSIPYTHRSYKRHREIILPAEAAGFVQPIREKEKQRLVFAIAQGRIWLQELMQGTPLYAIADRERRTERSIRMTLSLAFLDPKLVRAAIDGRLPRGVSARRLVDLPPSWPDQWRALGLAPPDRPAEGQHPAV
jgi:DNA invertase Pin-like site-specific DNA recombinase